MGESGWASNTFAETWKRGAESRNRLLAAATERMLGEARVVAGARVLDLGAGTGDTTILAALRVGESGAVIATDASAAMIEAASEACRTAGFVNVTVRLMEATTLDFPQASFDAVIARQVLMFLDLRRALSEVHRVLRQGGRFAAVVWGPLEKNPFHCIVIDAARARGAIWGETTPEVVRAFARGDPQAYRLAMVEAGFGEVTINTVGASRRFASAAEALEAIRESPIHSEPIARLAESEQPSAWEEVETQLLTFERPGGLCEVPSETLVIAGEK